MDVLQARAFLAVAHQLHFGRAATSLNIAQPPLSRQIRQLERQIGARLFDRSTRHVALTPAGEALIESAEELVKVSEQAPERVREALEGETGRVRLGYSGASINRKVGELTRRVRAARPGVTLELYSSQFSHLGLDRVREGSLDVVLGRWDFLPAEIESSVVACEEILAVLPSTHPLADREAVSMAQLKDESWIVLPSGMGAALQGRLNSLAMAKGFTPKVAQTAPDSWTQLVLVGAEMGCALSLDSVRDNIAVDGAKFIPMVEADKPLEVRMIWRRTDATPALRSVLQIAQQVFAAAAE